VPDDIYDLMIWLIPFSIIGARLYYVLFELDYYIQNPGDVLAIRNGGLAIYGGIIAGIIVVFLVCRHKKIPMAAMLDVVVFGLLIGQILGRWGNFMNREAFGAETAVFCRMGLTSPEGSTIYVHPTFLYESLWNLGIFIFLTVFTKKGKRKYDGQCILLYFLLYGIGRSWIEGLRTDSLYIGTTGIRVSQALSLTLAVAALIILIVQSRREHPAEKLFVNQVAQAKQTETEAETTDKNI
jgi:phosphatidylglycerol:prolipoprotein diacylglycerol transferase